MYRHKIIGLLKSFSADEMIRFREFISSPYFNKNKKIIVLFDELFKHHPHFSSVDLDKKFIFKQIYPNLEFNDSTFRNLAAKLLNLGQNFILNEYSSDNNLTTLVHLTSALLNRGQNELYKINSKRLSTHLNDTKEIDFNFLYSKYLFERNQFNYTILNDKIIQKKKTSKQIESLTKSGNYLTIYYITEIICLYLNYFIYSDKYNLKDHDYLKRVLENLNFDALYIELKEKCDCSFILKMYILLYKSFSQSKKVEYYFEYKNFLISHSGFLSRDEISFHYSKLISYCILKRNSNDNTFNSEKELFNLYENILNQKFYKNERYPYLPTSLFRDILLLSLSIEKFDWAYSFIKVYSKEVAEKEEVNIYNFGMAFFHYGKGNFITSLDFINKISIDHFIYKYDIKNLSLKIFYELDYTEEALCLIHSYKEFLRNNDFMPDERKKKHKNYIKYLEKLILIKSGNYVTDLDYLKYEVNKKKNILYKNWFNSKIDELINNTSGKPPKTTFKKEA